MKAKCSLIVLVVILLEGFWIRPVSAQQIVFGIKPENPNLSYFEFTLKPGESIQETLVASNQSDVKIHLKIKPVNGITAMGGGISFDFLDQGGSAEWIAMELIDDLELYPNRIKRIPFSLTVPPGTPPGEYVAGFLSALSDTATPTPPPSGEESQFKVSVVAQVGVAVIIHVPGPVNCNPVIQEVQTMVQAGQWRIDAMLENPGNIHFSGTGEMLLQDSATGSEYLRKNIQFDYFVPGTSAILRQYMDLPPEGKYLISLALVDRNNPNCRLDYSQEVTIGAAQVATQQVQATRIAGSLPTPQVEAPSIGQITPLAPSTAPTKDQQWILWLSLAILMISIGLVLYAVTTLKARKKE